MVPVAGASGRSDSGEDDEIGSGGDVEMGEFYSGERFPHVHRLLTKIDAQCHSVAYMVNKMRCAVYRHMRRQRVCYMKNPPSQDRSYCSTNADFGIEVIWFKQCTDAIMVTHSTVCDVVYVMWKYPPLEEQLMAELGALMRCTRCTYI